MSSPLFSYASSRWKTCGSLSCSSVPINDTVVHRPSEERLSISSSASPTERESPGRLVAPCLKAYPSCQEPAAWMPRALKQICRFPCRITPCEDHILIILSENKKGKVTFLRRERDSNPRGFRPAVFKTAAIVHSAIPPLTVYHIGSPQWKGLSHQSDSNELPM